ncbi:cupin domain-containing protein [Natribaculum luteum]|uniref:Cupin domain-containing protein n=1 Tax=Natribaculum luteum TaxID=1586232 RepID=A0ABD5NZB6_9EURY|nr:cupin domain-containing protein [Natribaculum luteum]
MTPKTQTKPLAVDVHRFDGVDVWQDGDERARIRGYFPLSPGTPNAGDVSGEDLMIVSIEIESGNYLPTHRDSNEELLLVTEGAVEATVGDETVGLSSGECTIVPKMEPHGLRNVGDDTARVVGFFPNDELTATFDAPLFPFESSVVTIGGETDDPETE